MSDTTPDPNDPLWQAAQQIAAQKNASTSQSENSQSVGQSSVPNTQSNSVQDSKEPDENDPLWIAAQQISNKKNSDNDALWQAALHVTAKNGSLKKEDPDTYTNLVQQHALDNTYDPASQAAQDKVNGTDSRDFNFDVYNARYNQGFKNDTSGWDTVKNAIPNVVHSFTDPAFVKRVGEAAYQASPYLLTAGAIQPIANQLGVSAELPSISGRSMDQNIAEYEAAADVARDRSWASLRGLGDFPLTNFKDMSKKDQNDYFDRQVHDQLNIEQAAKGQGFLDKLNGLGNQVQDVAGVKDASGFAFADPVQLGMMVAAPYIGAGTAALGSYTASKIASILPEASTVGSAVGSGLKGLAPYASPGLVGLGMGGLEYARSKDPINALVAGILASEGDKAFKLQEGMADFGDFLKGAAPEGYVPPIPIRIAQKIGSIGSTIASTPEFKTALGGAIYSAPFALASDDPDKKRDIILNGLVTGAALGTIPRLGSLLDARYNASTNADFYKNLPTNPSEYGTQYDAPTNEAMKVATQDQRDLLYRNRNLLPGNTVQTYPVLDDQFQQTALPRAEQFFQSKGYDAETATNLAKNTIAKGVYYGADPNNVPQIFMKLSQFNAENLYHETGHFISDVVNSNIAKARDAAALAQKNGQPISQETAAMLDTADQLEKAVPTGKSRQTVEKSYIERLYNLDALQKQIDGVQKLADSGDPQAQSHLDNLNEIKQEFEAVHKNGLPDDVFKNEWLADQFSLASRGLLSGKQAGLSHTISQGLGSFLDTIAPGAISKYLTSRQTPLGFRPSFIAADVFDHWIEERAQAIKGSGSGWKEPVSANNAPTEANSPNSTNSTIPPENPLKANENIAPVPTNVDPVLMKTAADTLVGLKIPKRQVLPMVTKAIESLRNEGVDVSNLKLEDIIARALKGRGESPTSLANANTQNVPLSKPSINPPLQGIPQVDEPIATPKQNLRNPLRQIPVSPEPSQILNPESFVDIGTLAKEGKKNPNGLSTATHREVMPDLSINENPQHYLTGSKIDTSDPYEATILKQALADSPNPAMLQSALNVIQDAIAKGETTNVAYDSAKNDLQSAPSSQNRSNNQSLADKGFLPRESVQKSINPTSIQAQTLSEPVFEGNSLATSLKAADDFAYKGKKLYKDADSVKKDLLELYQANQENRPPNLDPNKTKYLLKNFVPNQLKTRLYSMNFSYDKVVGNIDLLSRTIVDSGLKEDPYWSKVYDYLNGKEIEGDMQGRLENIANGKRGDGAELQGITQKVNPNYKNPYMLDDFKTQVLNALEGGPSRTFFKESNQNISGLRGIKVDPFNDAKGANPLYNKLTALGEKAKLFEKDASGNTIETNGINNILNDATEKIRLDRINSITSQAVNKPTSQYVNRAIGFTPGSGVAPGIDATINPTSRNLIYQLQGIAGASSERKPQ